MTILGSAKNSIITPLIKKISRQEKIPARQLLERIRQGTIVIPLNNNHSIEKPCGVGLGLRTKVNANIGTSTDAYNLDLELEKTKVAIRYGADTIMDLSVGGNLSTVRTEIIKISSVPVGTVPLYEISVNAQRRHQDFLKFDAQDILEVLRAQAEQGVDFFTIHAGVTKYSTSFLTKQKRVLGVVSRGGAILLAWMKAHKEENPFFTHFDKILDIACAYDITLSLGDGLRPGSVLDATDSAQIAELKVLGALARRARRRDVQVIIEGPGHVPLDQIKKNIRLEKKICGGAPFYVLGPLVTDVASGWDHITSAIGGAIAAQAGADFLCYVTPAEHLKHPSAEDVREGIIASRIAAHAADIVKGNKAALQWDREMSQARRRRDWKKQIQLSIDPEKAEFYRASSLPRIRDVCTMCGDFCSIKLSEASLG
ncbi:MAG: phosphomethylpyrimidine synthase ThiC [Candidatus Omnitrophica bacterium]|nr:phosphomethylpyrimidine synthase ThiC [Candidatus Omnitrophota bacterium]